MGVLGPLQWGSVGLWRAGPGLSGRPGGVLRGLQAFHEGSQRMSRVYIVQRFQRDAKTSPRGRKRAPRGPPVCRNQLENKRFSLVFICCCAFFHFGASDHLERLRGASEAPGGVESPAGCPQETPKQPKEVFKRPSRNPQRPTTAPEKAQRDNSWGIYLPTRVCTAYTL